jgi:hypothetical protein
MAMEMFHHLFPEIGTEEYQSVTVADSRWGLPLGEYGFAEAYCIDAGCDCRNLLLNVVGGTPPRWLATLNYALDPGGFKEVEEEGQVMLDILNPQSELSFKILDMFRETLARDAVFLERVERHLAMVKKRLRENSRAGPRNQSHVKT